MMSHAARGYDVVVAGGGLAGAAAALKAARGGCRVVLGEQRGGLGWEATRGWRVFGERPADGMAGELASALDEIGGYRGGFVNPALLEGLLDRMLVEAGVDLLFHAWPSGIVRSGGETAGALFATKFGALPLQAPVVIDATHEGLLIGRVADLTRTERPSHVHHALILVRSELGRPLRITDGLPERVSGIDLQPLGHGEICATLDISTNLCPPETGLQWWGEMSTARVLVPVLKRLRQEPGLERCEVAYRADEAWVMPSVVVETSRKDGVIAVGVSCKEVRDEVLRGGSLFSALVRAGEAADTTLANTA